jgi:hypothetical protein
MAPAPASFCGTDLQRRRTDAVVAVTGLVGLRSCHAHVQHAIFCSRGTG